MKSEEKIVRSTKEEMEQKRREGKSKSDWKRATSIPENAIDDSDVGEAFGTTPRLFICLQK